MNLRIHAHTNQNIHTAKVITGWYRSKAHGPRLLMQMHEPMQESRPNKPTQTGE